MRISEHLTHEQRQQLNQFRNPKKKKHNKFRKQDILDAMGTSMPTYKRVRGAIRRK